LYLLKTQKFSLRKVYIFHYFSLFMSDRPVPYIAIFAGAMLIGSEIASSVQYRKSYALFMWHTLN